METSAGGNKARNGQLQVWGRSGNGKVVVQIGVWAEGRSGNGKVVVQIGVWAEGRSGNGKVVVQIGV